MVFNNYERVSHDAASLHQSNHYLHELFRT
jgi:hypothetical protein